jgi:hypothetical protein
MISHHEAAIPMARAIVERSPEVERFAKNVIAAEQVSIENMQEMLKDMEAPPVREDPAMKRSLRRQVSRERRPTCPGSGRCGRSCWDATRTPYRGLSVPGQRLLS